MSSQKLIPNKILNLNNKKKNYKLIQMKQNKTKINNTQKKIKQSLKYDQDMGQGSGSKRGTIIIVDTWECNSVRYSKAYSSVLFTRFISEFRDGTMIFFLTIFVTAFKRRFSLLKMIKKYPSSTIGQRRLTIMNRKRYSENNCIC